ncbi:TnpV protein [Thomasclavelia sp.]
MVRQMAESQNVTEELKRQDQMAWVGRMNQIKNMAEEIVWDELICR